MFFFFLKIPLKRSNIEILKQFLSFDTKSSTAVVELFKYGALSSSSVLATLWEVTNRTIYSREYRSFDNPVFS